MNRCKVSDVISEIAANAEDSGICVSTEEGQQRVIAELNVALPLLMKRVDAAGMMMHMAVPVCGGCFWLPEEFLEARQIFLNGFGTIQRSQYYQGQLSSGLNTCGTQCCWSEVIDLGDFAIPQPLPNFRPIYITLAAESNADAGKEVTVEITNQYGKQVKETLTLLPEMGYVKMSEGAVDVTYVGKPLTDGDVRMYLSYDNGQRIHLCDYGPKVQSGAFRRKKLPSWCPYGTNLIRIYGKMRARKITSMDDIIPVCDVEALSWALSAVTAMRRKDTAGFNECLLQAVNALWKELGNQDSASNVQPVFFDFGACSPSQASNGGRCWN